MKGESDPGELTPPKLASRRRGWGWGGGWFVTPWSKCLRVSMVFSSTGLCLCKARVLAAGWGLDSLSMRDIAVPSFLKGLFSTEEPCGGGRGGRPLVVEDMPSSLVSSLLDDDSDSAECHWLDEMPLCVFSTLLMATLGLLLRLSRLMVVPCWKLSTHLR